MAIAKSILIALLLTIVPSCGFLFYNYRASMQVLYIIPNPQVDTTIRYNVGRFLLRESSKASFYGRKSTDSFSYIEFYGPDYHTLEFRIREEENETYIYFKYFGFNGWRSRPPQKKFIEAIRDSLVNNFGAREMVLRNINNERTRSGGN